MHVTNIQTTIHEAQPNPNPIRDALQTLPGAGAVEVVVQTDAGVTGRGNAWFGRITGAPTALAAIIEHELKPVVLGAEVTSVRGVHGALRRDAVDILQPDLRRAGGPTALLQIGLMAHAFGRPYASHAGEAAHLHVMAALPNAIYLETGLIGPHSPFQLVDGCAPVPDTPGLHWADA